jgi:hypothetical protein
MKELREQLPSLYAQEHEADPLVICKFFTPDSSGRGTRWRCAASALVRLLPKGVEVEGK